MLGRVQVSTEFTVFAPTLLHVHMLLNLRQLRTYKYLTPQFLYFLKQELALRQTKDEYVSKMWSWLVSGRGDYPKEVLKNVYL